MATLGAQAALDRAGAPRGDWATLSRHLDALPETERPGYQAGAVLATRLATTAESATAGAEADDVRPVTTIAPGTSAAPAPPTTTTGVTDAAVVVPAAV